MSEGTLMEVAIAVGAVVTVFTAVGAILYRITVGDRAARKLDRLKDELERERAGKPAGAPPAKHG